MSSKRSKPKGTFRISEGDWFCPNEGCGNVNFSRRLECNRCGQPREFQSASKSKDGVELGKKASEQYNGLFSPNDWVCPKCGNINWAKRNNCNVCNAPKISNEDPRTGTGGGYKENDNIEYKERESSDGEFDEFGMRKKRKEVQKEKDVVNQSYNDEEINEEEDEDEEDEDLSKYNLSGDESSESLSTSESESSLSCSSTSSRSNNKK